MHIIITNFINSSYYLIPKTRFKFLPKLNTKISNLLQTYKKKSKFNFKKVSTQHNFVKTFKKFLLFVFVTTRFKFYNKFFTLTTLDQKKILKKYSLKFLKIFFNLIYKNNSVRILKLFNLFKTLTQKYTRTVPKKVTTQKPKLFINYITYKYDTINSLLGYQTLLSSSLNENFFLLRDFNLKKQFLYYFQIDLPNMSRKILRKKFTLSPDEEFFLYTTPFNEFSILPLTVSENQTKFFKTYYKSTSLKNHLKGNLELLNLINLNHNFIKSLFIFKKKINWIIFNSNQNQFYFNQNSKLVLKLSQFIFFNSPELLNLKLESYDDITLKFFFKKIKPVKIFNNFKKINYFQFYQNYKKINQILKIRLKSKFKIFKIRLKQILNLIFYKNYNYSRSKKVQNLTKAAYKIFMDYKKYKTKFKLKFKNITIPKLFRKRHNFKVQNYKKFKLTKFKSKFKKFIFVPKSKLFNNRNLFSDFKYLNYFNLNKTNRLKSELNYKKTKKIETLFNNLNLKPKFKKKKALVQNLNYFYLKFKLILKFNEIVSGLVSIKKSTNKFKFFKKYSVYLSYFFSNFVTKITQNKFATKFFKVVKKKFFATIALNYKRIILSIFINLVLSYYSSVRLTKKSTRVRKLTFLKNLIKSSPDLIYNLVYKFISLSPVVSKLDQIEINPLTLYNFDSRFSTKKLIWFNEIQIYNFITNYKNNYILSTLNATT